MHATAGVVSASPAAVPAVTTVPAAAVSADAAAMPADTAAMPAEPAVRLAARGRYDDVALVCCGRAQPGLTAFAPNLADNVNDSQRGQHCQVNQKFGKTRQRPPPLAQLAASG
jgi:hypothetical protein